MQTEREHKYMQKALSVTWVQQQRYLTLFMQNFSERPLTPYSW